MRRLPRPLLLAALGLTTLAPGCASGGGGDDAGTRPGMDAGMVTMVDSGLTCPMACPTGTVCRGRVCVAACSPEGGCEGGRSCCENACVNLANSITDCGACNAGCTLASNLCTDGACRCGAGPPCEAGMACCGGRCVDLYSDATACGDCVTRCMPEEVCEDATCVMPPCSPACTGDETCVEGMCMCGSAGACEDGTTCCGGGCVDTQTSASHCGLCGNACPSDQVCLDGTCTDDVPCEPACGPGESCVRGSCMCGSSAPCAGSQTCCDGACVNTTTSNTHCGRCGNACGSSTCCAGACRNLQTDDDHCGRCGEQCEDRSDTCSGGSCICGAAGAECTILQLCSPFGCVGF